MKNAVSLTSICAGILMHSTLLSAQTYVVVLKVQTRDVINPNAEVITLASGARISVPMTDIDYDITQKLQSLLSQSTIAAAPGTPGAPIANSAAVIRPKCAKDWPSDFQMRAFCEKVQQEAVTKLSRRPMGSGDLRVIREKCAGDWVDDFQMRNFCEEQQLNALKALGR